MLRPKLNALIFAFAVFGSLSCTVTTHPSQRLSLSSSVEDLRNMTPPSQTIKFKKIVAADWQVSRAGLINLNDDKAKSANLEDGMEPIQIYFYVLDHPTQGRYLIDSGISEAIAQDTEESPIPSIMKYLMNFASLKTHTTTREFAKTSSPIIGIFLTHMHADHILGLPDLPKTSKIFVGPNESRFKDIKNAAVQGVSDELLQGHQVIQELEFPETKEGLAAHDFFGDGSLVVIFSPGHTPGSLSFLIYTEQGYQLVVGDSCHTKWGWENLVAPGDFTMNQSQNLATLKALKTIANTYNASVHLGHQSI